MQTEDHKEELALKMHEEHEETNRGDETEFDVDHHDQLEEFEEESFFPSPHYFSSTEKSNMVKLCIMIAMVAVFFVAELVVGYVGKSLALVSDSFHMLSDGISLVVGLAAIIISKRRASDKLSYGWGRAELLGGLINGVFLISVVIFIYLEAIQRIFEPAAIEKPLMILVVGVAGLAVNLIGMIMFCGHAHHHHGHDHGHSHSHDHGHGHSHGHSHDHGHNHEHSHEHSDHSHGSASSNEEHHHHRHINFNMLGVFLHVFGDFLGSIGVVITAVLLLIFKDPTKHRWTLYVDPIVSSILATIILASSIPLVINCAKILLQRVPNNVQIRKLKRQIRSLKGVRDVHELHVWQFVNNRVICSMHIKTDSSRDFVEIAEDIQGIMHSYGVHSTTIQPEPMKTRDNQQQQTRSACELTCGNECQTDWCCPPQQQHTPQHKQNSASEDTENK